MFNKKNILITGGTGSFGKTYTKVLLENYKPNKIIIILVMSSNNLKWQAFLMLLVCVIS